MKMTLNIDEEVLEKAIQLTRIKDLNKLINFALGTLIKKETSKRLALLGGPDKNALNIRRRKSKIY